MKPKTHADTLSRLESVQEVHLLRVVVAILLIKIGQPTFLLERLDLARNANKSEKIFFLPRAKHQHKLYMGQLQSKAGWETKLIAGRQQVSALIFTENSRM